MLNLYKYSLLSCKHISRFLKALLGFRERESKITLKTLGLRLNMRLYDRLSKEVDNFKD